MDNEMYMIKRMPWEYDKLAEYYAGVSKFTRNIHHIRIFDSMVQASEVIQDIKKYDPEAKNYTFSIVRM